MPRKKLQPNDITESISAEQLAWLRLLKSLRSGAELATAKLLKELSLPTTTGDATLTCITGIKDLMASAGRHLQTLTDLSGPSAPTPSTESLDDIRRDLLA